MIINIYELFILEGELFVTETYKTILGRDPDSHGLAYYCGRMAAGCSKSYVIYQIYLSSEADSNIINIPGLKQIIRQERRLHHWFWGLFYKKNFKKEDQINSPDRLIYALKKIIHDEIELINKELIEKIEALRVISAVNTVSIPMLNENALSTTNQSHQWMSGRARKFYNMFKNEMEARG